LLLTAKGTTALNPQVEGQYLVPQMCAPRDRWNPDLSLDYEMIRNRWLAALQSKPATSEGSVPPYIVIEKSPPNMCRYRALVSMLGGMKTHIVVMTRDPFATCASWHLRNGPRVIHRQWGWPDNRPPTDENSYFRALARTWVTRAEYLYSARHDAIVWMRYEEVSENSAAAIRQIGRVVPNLLTASADANICVKDYPPQKMRNMNREQVSKLTKSQLAQISIGLMEHAELVEKLGYEVAYDY
jgi:hypothetical protein